MQCFDLDACINSCALSASVHGRHPVVVEQTLPYSRRERRPKNIASAVKAAAARGFVDDDTWRKVEASYCHITTQTFVGSKRGILRRRE